MNATAFISERIIILDQREPDVRQAESAVTNSTCPKRIKKETLFAARLPVLRLCSALKYVPTLITAPWKIMSLGEKAIAGTHSMFVSCA